MIHWVGSYALIALVAGLSVAMGRASAWAGAAALIAGLSAARALLALLTHAFGRGRDGPYSFERAFTLTLVSTLVVAGAGVWLGQGWSAADAGRALDRSVAAAIGALL